MYRVNKQDGYICGVVSGVGATISNITEKEYREIKSVLMNAPNAPAGYYYRLRESLEWELCEMPAIREEATEQDYRTALEKLGVRVDA